MPISYEQKTKITEAFKEFKVIFKSNDDIDNLGYINGLEKKWKDSSTQILQLFNQKIIKKSDKESNKFLVNFDEKLTSFMKEAKYMDKLGIKLDREIQI